MVDHEVSHQTVLQFAGKDSLSETSVRQHLRLVNEGTVNLQCSHKESLSPYLRPGKLSEQQK